MALEPQAGFPGTIRIAGERAELISSPLMTAVASLNLALSGPLARTPRIAGRVDVVSIDVSVPDRLPATVQPLPGIRRINTPPDIRARVSVEAAIAMVWRDWVGDSGESVSIEHFGASAEGEILMEQFGFTVDAVVTAAHTSLQRATEVSAPVTS